MTKSLCNRYPTNSQHKSQPIQSIDWFFVYTVGLTISGKSAEKIKMKKQITQKEAKEKYGVVISKMQHYNNYKFYLLDNGDVVDSNGDIRYTSPK